MGRDREHDRKMKIRSFAKINLGIEVIRKRDDNYHDIRTLLQTIDLFDVLEFTPLQHEGIYLKGNDKSISWDKDNLIFRAAALLKDKFKVRQGVEICVHKKIPPGKGLGGGSSNAAVTLYSMNNLWDLRLKKEDLMELGSTLGTDVPFFLEGGLCLGTERGDKIKKLSDLAPLFCLLILPSFSISTPLIYSRLSLTSLEKDSKINRFLAEKNASISTLENRLEETVFSLYPQLKEINDLFHSVGAELFLVSGTGSAVFGLFRDIQRAEKMLEELIHKYPSCLVKTLSRRSYWKKLKVGV